MWLWMWAMDDLLFVVLFVAVVAVGIVREEREEEAGARMPNGRLCWRYRGGRVMFYDVCEEWRIGK